jgi:hypothetical protein
MPGLIGQLAEAKLDANGFTKAEASASAKTGAANARRIASQADARAAATKARRAKGKAPEKGSGSGGDFEAKHPRGAGSEGGRFVRKGTSGDHLVRGVQRRVGVKTDGAFGAKTEAAVKALQARYGLTQDGIVGHATARALLGMKTSKAQEGRLTEKDRRHLRGRVREADGLVGAGGLQEISVSSVANANWREVLHPRGAGGKFASKPGGGRSVPSGGGRRRPSPASAPAAPSAPRAPRGDAPKVAPPGAQARARQRVSQDAGVAAAMRARGMHEPVVLTEDFEPPTRVSRALRGMVKPEVAASPKARQPFSNGDELYAQATKDYEGFQAVLDLGQGVSRALGARVSTSREAAADPSQSHVVIGSMKKREVAETKVAAKYGGDYSRLGDVIRGTVVVPSLDDLPGAVAHIQAEAEARGWKLRAPENRFLAVEGDPVHTGPTPAGYRDFSVMLESPSGVQAELQVNTHAMFAAKQGEGHRLYEQERGVMREAAIANRELTSEEKAKVAGFQAQQRALYTQAFSDSYFAGKKRPAGSMVQPPAAPTVRVRAAARVAEAKARRAKREAQRSARISLSNTMRGV